MVFVSNQVPAREAGRVCTNFVHAPPSCPSLFVPSCMGTMGSIWAAWSGAMGSLHRTFRNLEQGSLARSQGSLPRCLPRHQWSCGKRGNNLHLCILVTSVWRRLCRTLLPSSSPLHPYT